MADYARDSRVIFDLGMNNGDDAAFYLSRGFTVVALDANPALCEKAQGRFRAAVDEGRLTILNAAIWEKTGEATFYVNLDNDHWSSLDIGWAGREGTQYKEIAVRCVTLSDLFGEFGVPHYLKIDVEGVDHSVLKQLRHNSLLPLYVSVEDCRFGFQYLELLASCNYNGFKLLDQSSVSNMKDSITGRVFSAGSSGPFGSDLPGEWRSHEEIVGLYSATVRDHDGKRLAPRTRWWDIHCTHVGSARTISAQPQARTL